MWLGMLFLEWCTVSICGYLAVLVGWLFCFEVCGLFVV